MPLPFQDEVILKDLVAKNGVALLLNAIASLCWTRATDKTMIGRRSWQSVGNDLRDNALRLQRNC